jgi:hypothetical protein
MYNWKFDKRHDGKIIVETDPPVEALSAFFSELSYTRIPFLLDKFSQSNGFNTETCSLRFYGDLEEEDHTNGTWFKEGFIQFSGQYCKGGLMNEVQGRQLVLEFAQRVLEQHANDNALQEKWIYNRRKEWFKDEEYYAYYISFSESWKDAMEENIGKMTDRR